MNIPQIQFFHDVEHIQAIPTECAVAARAESRCIRSPRTDVIEEHHPVIFYEGRINVSPHALVAAVSMREHDGLFAASKDFHVVSVKCRRIRHCS